MRADPPRSFKTEAEARLPLFTRIEGWYDPRQRHPDLGYRSPVNFERIHSYTVIVDRGIPVYGLSTAPLAPGLIGSGDGAVDNPALGV